MSSQVNPSAAIGRLQPGPPSPKQKTFAVFAAAIQQRLREPRSSLRALRAPAAGLPWPPPSLARSLVGGPSGGRLGRTHGLRRTAAAGPPPASPGAPDAACLGQGDGLGRNRPKASSASLLCALSRVCALSREVAESRRVAEPRLATRRLGPHPGYDPPAGAWAAGIHCSCASALDTQPRQGRGEPFPGAGASSAPFLGDVLRAQRETGPTLALGRTRHRAGSRGGEPESSAPAKARRPGVRPRPRLRSPGGSEVWEAF